MDFVTFSTCQHQERSRRGLHRGKWNGISSQRSTLGSGWVTPGDSAQGKGLHLSCSRRGDGWILHRNKHSGMIQLCHSQSHYSTLVSACASLSFSFSLQFGPSWFCSSAGLAEMRIRSAGLEDALEEVRANHSLWIMVLGVCLRD